MDRETRNITQNSQRLLCKAIESKDYDMFFRLINRGANLYGDCSYKSPIVKALFDKDFPHKRLLQVKNNGDNVTKNPLTIAIMYNCNDAVRNLLYGGNFKVPHYDYGKISFGDRKISSCPNLVFEYATKNKMNDIMDILLRKNLVDINSRNEFGELPVLQLISTHRNVLAMNFLKSCKDLEVPSTFGETIFDRAINSKNNKIVSYLMANVDPSKLKDMFPKIPNEHGFLSDFSNKVYSLKMDDATRMNYLERLLHYGENRLVKKFFHDNNCKLSNKEVNTYNSYCFGKSLLYDLVNNDLIDIAKKLIRNGLDVNFKINEGETLLYNVLLNLLRYPMESSRQLESHKDMIYFLIDQGADLFSVDKSGYSIFSLCLCNGINTFDKDILKAIINGELKYLDDKSYSKLNDIFSSQPNIDVYSNLTLFKITHGILRKYYHDKKENNNYTQTFEKVTDILSGILDTRSQSLKEILLFKFEEMLSQDNKPFNKYILEKGIPKGLEGVSLLLADIFNRSEDPYYDYCSYYSPNENLKIKLKRARELNCENKTNKQIFDDAMSLLSARDVRRNGFAIRKVLSSLVKLNDFDYNSNTLAADFFANIVSISKTSRELVNNLGNAETMLMNFPTDKIISCLNKSSMENFSLVIERNFRKMLNVPEDLKQSFTEFYHSLRKPEAFLAYSGKIKQYPEVKRIFENDFVIPCIEGDFYKKIYNQNQGTKNNVSHFDIVFKDRKQLLEMWKNEDRKEFSAITQSNKNNNFIITQTKNPIDMFLIGTEIESSCQNVYGNAKYNKCLMGYVLNPCTQGIMIKDRENGTIVARSIFRILWNEDKKSPVLLLEKTYIKEGLAPKDYEKMIVTYAVQRAREMRMPLVSTTFSNYGKKAYKDKVVSYDSGKAPFEYSDATRGITSGKYAINDKMNILYEPKLELARDSFKSNLSKKMCRKNGGREFAI